MHDKHQTGSGAATAAYETDGRTQWQVLQQSETDWHQTFNNLLDKGHIFMGQTYSDTGMLFRGMPAGLAEAMEQDGFWHCQHENPLCQLERELDVIFCSEVARDALAVARPWQDKARDAVILIFSSKIFVERWQARNAAMLGFADVGMVFKYPCLAAPLDWSDLHGIVLHPDAVPACKSRFAGWPEIQRPHIAAPAVTDATCRESWQAVIDEMLAGQRLTAAVSQPTTEFPQRSS